jgi:hypothetical protein
MAVWDNALVLHLAENQKRVVKSDSQTYEKETLFRELSATGWFRLGGWDSHPLEIADFHGILVRWDWTI